MEKDNNIILSCSEHGKEQYFKIQKQGAKRNSDCTYVWFENLSGGVERMWVKVIKGNKQKGSGVLVNSPIKLRDLKPGDYVSYITNKDKITRAREAFEGPFCAGCGEYQSLDEETGKKRAELH